MKRLQIFTDGSSLGNPGPCGYAAIIAYDGKEKIVRGGESTATNNRMEMLAIIHALEWVANERLQTPIELFSDSRLVIESLNKNWKRKANLDLWERLDRVRKKLKIRFQWVKGHADHFYNNRCDRMAVEEAEKQRKKMIASHGNHLDERDLHFEKNSNGKVDMDSKTNFIISENTGKKGVESRKEAVLFKKEEKLFHCAKCGKKTAGLYGLLTDSGMIRVDCTECGNYLMFAEKTLENRKKAAKRRLINKEALKKVVQAQQSTGRKISENDIKKIKAWTQKQAQEFLNKHQTLF
ncbi:ribonuclease HI [Candidatus Peregrinibacteria bacterium]|nr:ribonuclease HI [Candidatus Peregrinibacteria bacterium]